MTSNPVDLVYVDGVAVAKSDVRGHEKQRLRQRVADATEVRNTNFSGQYGGLYVYALNANFDLNTSDTTTVDDGVNCIRDSAGNGFFSDLEGSLLSSGIEFTMDGGGSPLIAGYQAIIEVPFNGTFTRSTVLADQVGNLVLDIRKTTYALFPPDPLDSIVASAPPTLSAAQSSQDSTLTGWTVAATKGDLLALYIVSASTVQKATLSLLITRN